MEVEKFSIKKIATLLLESGQNNRQKLGWNKSCQ